MDLLPPRRPVPLHAPRARVSRGGSPQRAVILEKKGVHAVLMAALLALALGAASAHAAIPNLTVDGAQTFQRVAGVGVNINVNSWSGGALEPALEMLLQPPGAGGAGMSVFRVIRDPMTWVASESDISLLGALDRPTLDRIYQAPAMEDLWSTIAYLNSRGVPGDRIMLNFMGWTPTWLGGGGAYDVPSNLTPGKESELAIMIASLVYYGRVVRGLDFQLLAPVNEEDWNCLEGPCIDSDQYVVFMHALVAELDLMGLSDVRLVGPDTASEANADGYISAMMGDATIAGRVDHFGLHAYGAPSGPGTPYAGHDYWLTETGASCSTCDTGGTPPQGEWTFSTDNADIVLGSLGSGLPMVAYYDGYDSFYYHHNGYGTRGLLAYDTTTAVYTPRKRFYVMAQISGFVEPGTRRISLTNSLSALGTTLAFFDSTSGLLAIIGRNTSSSSITISGQLKHLPVLDTLTCTLTDAVSSNLTPGAPIVVTGGAFTATIPPLTVFSLAGRDPLVTGVAPQPPGTVSASLSGARPNPTSAGVEFTLTLPGAADVSLDILDIQGRMVWQAPSRGYDAGRWTLVWSGRTAAGPAPAGVYLARIRAAGRVFTRTVVIVP